LLLRLDDEDKSWLLYVKKTNNEAPRFLGPDNSLWMTLIFEIKKILIF